MSSLYYEMRDAKVRIAEELSHRGWEIIGFKEDESDSMTDYYSPANWNGIATKNGFILCVDCSSPAERKEIKKYNYGNCLNQSDIEKIKKLEALTQDRGATEGEEDNAQRMIEKIKANTSDKPTYEVTGYTIAHMANPGKCKWHIEKDGCLYDKGIGITKYADVPESYMFDINTMEYKESYKYCSYYDYDKSEDVRKERTLSEREEKVTKELKALILKWERITNSMNGMYNGTKENRKEAEEQATDEKMEKVTVKETKIVLRMIEVTNRKEIKVNDYITVSHHGHYWKITSEYMQKGTWKGVQESKKAFIYEIVGSESRGYQSLKNPKSYYNYEFRMLKEMELGNIKIFELKEVEEVTEVEKWVKINKKKETIYKEKETIKDYNSDTVTTSEGNTATNTVTSATAKYNFTITEEQDTRDNSTLWVVRLTDKLEREQWKEYNELMKSNKGYYSKFKGGHIFKENPTDKLNVSNDSKVIEFTEQDEEQAENLLDTSTTIIEMLHLGKMEYVTSIEYKQALTSYLLNSKKKISKGMLNYLHQEEHFEFEKVLADLLKDNNSNNSYNSKTKIVDEPTATTINYDKLIDKINKQIETNNKQIEKLSGNYQTNTYKRMREQDNRDTQRHRLEDGNRLLNYLLNVCNSKTITTLEINLITKAFRDDMKQYSYHGEKLMHPSEHTDCAEWAKEGYKKQSDRLKKVGINNRNDLIKAVEEYKNIIEMIDKGNTIDFKAEQIKKLEREYKMTQKGDINFTTSKELLDTLMEYADIKQDENVLEPSAGIGNIADKLKEYTSNIDVCENGYSYSELLKLKGYNLIGSDFLQVNNYNSYSKIVANPPFSDEQKHIRHMYNMLKNGGRLVTICSPHWSFASDKESKEFREWLDTLTYEVIDVKEKQFEFTNVAVKILVIDKDEEISSKAM